MTDLQTLRIANDLARRFDQVVANNLRLEREAILRRFDHLREKDTHDEWRKMNEVDESV